MKSIFPVGIGLLCHPLWLSTPTLAQTPDSLQPPAAEVQTTLFVHLRPALLLDWPAVAATRLLLNDEENRSALGIQERVWTSLLRVDSATADTAYGADQNPILRVTIDGADPGVVMQPFVEQVLAIAAPNVGHQLVANPDLSQTLWLWSGTGEYAPSLTRFSGFEACPEPDSAPDIALSLCARLHEPGAPEGVMWAQVRLNETVAASFGVLLDDPDDAQEAERQLRLLLSSQNEASSAALAFLGLQSVQERVDVQSQNALVTLNVTLNSAETARLARLLHEALASEVE
jgi:hypothetical protein